MENSAMVPADENNAPQAIPVQDMQTVEEINSTITHHENEIKMLKNKRVDLCIRKKGQFWKTRNGSIIKISDEPDKDCYAHAEVVEGGHGVSYEGPSLSGEEVGSTYLVSAMKETELSQGLLEELSLFIESHPDFPVEAFKRGMEGMIPTTLLERKFVPVS